MSHPTPIYDLGLDQPSARIGIYISPILAVLGAMVLLIWAVTEWVAWRFGFHPNLGVPLLPAGALTQLVGLAVATLSGGLALAGIWVRVLRRFTGRLVALAAIALGAAFLPLYPPWSVFTWALRFGELSFAEPVFSTAWHLIAIPAHLLFIVAMVVAWRRARKNARLTDSHGSARWANDHEVEASGLLESDGVFLGIFQRNKRDPGTYLRHAGPEHVLGFAPTRSGKGVGWVIPTLLSWPHSTLVHDIKGENWAQTAGYRARELGNRCLKFDPTSNAGGGARYNPLLEIRRGEREVRDAQNVAEMLVDQTGNGHLDHWDVTSAELLVGAILHVLYVGRNKTLRGVLDLLTDPQTEIRNVLSRMKTTVHDPEGQAGWVDPVSGTPTRTHPVVAGAAQSLLNKSDNERSSVVSSAVKCLSLWRDDVVAGNTSACDFAIADLVEHEAPVSLYLVVPPSDIDRTRPLMRLLINQIGRRLTEELNPEGGQGRARRRLLLMMDEFPTLGGLEFFQTQLAYLAGYGIKAFLIVQDLSQLYAAYGHNESIVSNCHVRVAYAPNKVETAQLLSTMAGVATVRKGRRMYSGNRLAPMLMHVMESDEETQRPLITPDEVMRLPKDNALVFVAGQRPIWAVKARYFADRRLAKRSMLATPECADAIGHDWNTWTYVEPDVGEVEAPDVARELGSNSGDGEGLDALLPDDGEAIDDTLTALA